MTSDEKKAFEDIDKEHFEKILKCLEENGFISNCIEGDCGSSRYNTIRDLPKIFIELCKKFHIETNTNVDNLYMYLDNDYCMVAYNSNKYNEDEIKNMITK